MIVKSWSILILASIAFVALGCVLIWIVVRLLRSNRNQVLATAALVPSQELTIREPGELLLLVETPRFGSDYRNFEFEVIEKSTGHTTKMKYDFARAQGATYGVTTMRIPVGRMNAQQADTYLLRVAGLQLGKDYSRYRILLSRPYLARMALQIVGIVICGIGMLLSLLLALWQVLPLQEDESPAVSTVASPTPGVPGHTIDLETWKRQQRQQHPPG